MRFFLYIFLLLPALMPAQALNNTGVCVGAGTPNLINTNVRNQNQLYECAIYKDTTTAQVYVYDHAGGGWRPIIQPVSGVSLRSPTELVLGGVLDQNAIINATGYTFAVQNASYVSLGSLEGDISTEMVLTATTPELYYGIQNFALGNSTTLNMNPASGIALEQYIGSDLSSSALVLKNGITDRYASLKFDRPGTNIDSVREVRTGLYGIYMYGLDQSAYNTNALYYDPVGKEVSWGPSQSGSVGIGAYQNTGTNNGLSISSGNIRLHSAGATTPGAVDLLDEQFLGVGTKIFTEANSGSVSIPLKIRNTGAQTDDSGVGLQMLGGSTNRIVSAIENRITGGTIAGGTNLEFYNSQADSTLRKALTLDAWNVATIEGWLGGSNAIVAGALDVSTSLNDRKSNFEFIQSGSTLTLPNNLVEIGTTIFLNATYLAGSNSTINTPAAYPEFAWDSDQDAGTAGNQFYTTTLSISPAQSITLKMLEFEGEKRWKIISSLNGGGSSGGGGVTQMGAVTNSNTNGAVITGNTLQMAVADAANMGVLQLAGDLTGTAASPQIAANAVGTSEISANAVTNVKIANNTIQFAKIAQNSATTGQVVAWNGTAWAASDVAVEGFAGGGSTTVTSSLDCSTDASLRKRNFFLAQNATLILPNPSTLALGTMVDIDAVFETGQTGLITTPVTAYQEFSFSTDQNTGTAGNQFHTDNIRLDAMKSVTLKTVSIGGSARWKVLIHQ